MRRLNRLEYRNTIRDLLGHPFDPDPSCFHRTPYQMVSTTLAMFVLSPLHAREFRRGGRTYSGEIIDIPEKPPLRQHWRIVNSIGAQNPLKFDRSGAWHDGHVGKDKNKIGLRISSGQCVAQYRNS